MGRRRITSKAPRTPVRRSNRSSKESEEASTTPGQELAMRGLCKEDFFLCSQPNSQITVKWDCYSPDAMQQIKQNRGKFAAEDLSDIAMKLADEAGEILTAEPLTGLWTTGREVSVKQTGDKGVRRSTRKKRSRRPIGVGKGVNADEILDRLAQVLNRHDSTEAVNAVCPEDSKGGQETDLAVPLSVLQEGNLDPSKENLLASPTFDPSRKHVINLSTDLFESADQNPKPSTVCVEKTEQDLQKGMTGSLLIQAEDEWSDDDLFANTSLLLNEVICSPPRSTRLSKRKSLMNSPSEPQIKTKRFTEGTVPPFTPVNIGKISQLTKVENLPVNIGKLGSEQKGSSTRSCIQANNVLMENSSRETTTALNATVTSLSSSSKGSSLSTHTDSSFALKPNGIHNKPILEKVQKQELLQSRPNLIDMSEFKQNGNFGNSISFVSGKLDVIPNTQRLSSTSNLQPSGSRTFKRHNTFPAETASPKRAGSSPSHLNGVKRPIKTNNWQTGYSRSTTSNFKHCQNSNESSQFLPNGQKANMKSPSWSPLPRSRRRSSVDSSSFNTSLTDDLLCQLAEPDDLWDSQLVPELRVTTTTCSAKLQIENTQHLNTEHLQYAAPSRKHLTRSSVMSPSVNSITSKGLSSGMTTTQCNLPRSTVGDYSHKTATTTNRRAVPVSGNNHNTTATTRTIKTMTGSGNSHNTTATTTNRKTMTGSVGGLKTLPNNSFTNYSNKSIPQPAGSGNCVVPETNNNNSKLLQTTWSKTTPCHNVVPSQGKKISQSGKYQFKSRPGNQPKAMSVPKAKEDLLNQNSDNKGGNSGILYTKEKSSSVSNVKEMKSEFDDSFLSDDEFSNPQVLAMLKEVEIQATQATQEPKSPVLKCTQDEIEKKKKAALELRQNKLKIQKKKPVARHTARHYKPLF